MYDLCAALKSPSRFPISMQADWKICSPGQWSASNSTTRSAGLMAVREAAPLQAPTFKRDGRCF